MDRIYKLLEQQTVTGPGQAVQQWGSNRTYQAVVTGGGAVSAAVKVEVSNDSENWLELGTITISGNPSATDGFASDAPWRYARGNVQTISGPSAAVNLLMGF